MTQGGHSVTATKGTRLHLPFRMRQLRDVFSITPFSFGPYGSGWGGAIQDSTYLNNGQTVSAPYANSSTQLTSSSPNVLNYGVDPYTSTSYVATTGVGGAVIGSYYEYVLQAEYDIFGD